jgi:hypothetical protein
MVAAREDGPRFRSLGLRTIGQVVTLRPQPLTVLLSRLHDNVCKRSLKRRYCALLVGRRLRRCPTNEA